jgi:2-alkyl-3-oxoalkanoate reductase
MWAMIGNTEQTLQEKRVLVTGATGFIGGRLAQRLALEEEAIVTGTGRSLDKVPFLHETDVVLQRADLLDETAMATAIAGQEIIFHVAAQKGNQIDPEISLRSNVEATSLLLRLAAQSGVQRIIYTSSVNVYGPPGPGQKLIKESDPVMTDLRDVYGRTKAIAELKARELADKLAVDLVVVRPGMVYGPRAQSWILSLCRYVKKGVPVIFGKGNGLACPVYIDNLVDGMLLAAVVPQARNETYNFCDEPVTWREYFRHLGQICGRQPRTVPYWLAWPVAAFNEKFQLGLPLTRERLRFYDTQAIYDMSKARTQLGWQQRISFAEGMRRSGVWLQEEGLLEE